jgi:hypothetical protein
MGVYHKSLEGIAPAVVEKSPWGGMGRPPHGEPPHEKSTSAVFVRFHPEANRSGPQIQGVCFKSLVMFSPAVVEKLKFFFPIHKKI